MDGFGWICDGPLYDGESKKPDVRLVTSRTWLVKPIMSAHRGKADLGIQRPTAIPTYRSRNLPLLSTTRDTSFPSFIAFATIPSAVDLTSRTCV